jgi:hypothetical protein
MLQTTEKIRPSGLLLATNFILESMDAARMARLPVIYYY